MSYVVARPDGRFEIRESIHTPRGPRARTLASFRTLDDATLDHAEARATRPFDRARVITRALDRGAHYRPPSPATLAAQLLRSLASGGRLPLTLAQALRDQIGTVDGRLPDSIPPLFDWIGASSGERGQALRELLRMTDRLPPPRRRRERRFPRIHSAPA